MSYYEELAERMEKEGKVERLSVQMAKLEIGKPLIGRFLGREEVKSTKRNMPNWYRYTFDTTEGPKSFPLSGNFDRTTGEKLEIGKVYKITLKGKVDLSGGRTFKVFDTLAIQEPEEEGEGEGHGEGEE